MSSLSRAFGTGRTAGHRPLIRRSLPWGVFSPLMVRSAWWAVTSALSSDGSSPAFSLTLPLRPASGRTPGSRASAPFPVQKARRGDLDTGGDLLKQLDLSTGERTVLSD